MQITSVVNTSHLNELEAKLFGLIQNVTRVKDSLRIKFNRRLPNRYTNIQTPPRLNKFAEPPQANSPAIRANWVPIPTKAEVLQRMQ